MKEFPALGPNGFLRVAYTEWGPPAAPQTVVCVHGLTRNGRDFDFLARHLASSGMRVVAPDLPGRGRSDWAARPDQYATPLYLSVMSTLIARLDVREVDWIGTSLGGHIGMELAARPGAPIRRLVLNDFGARVAARALHRILASHAGARERRFRGREEVEAHLRSIHAPFGPLTDDQWRHMAEHSTIDLGNGALRLHHDPGVTAQIWWPLMMDLSLWDIWERVSCPVLILRGESSDLLLPATVKQMQQRGAAAAQGLVRVAEVAGCGHAPALMSEDQIRLVEEFLFSGPAGAVPNDARSPGEAVQ